ncbi:MAG: hypothetical protein O3B37_16085 [Proteobacteria bacterium]|nr:hypothetical protein [Pseudomonadota bacterium]
MLRMLADGVVGIGLVIFIGALYWSSSFGTFIQICVFLLVFVFLLITIWRVEAFWRQYRDLVKNPDRYFQQDQAGYWLVRDRRIRSDEIPTKLGFWSGFVFGRAKDCFKPEELKPFYTGWRSKEGRWGGGADWW